MTAVVSSSFSVQIVGSASPYTNWTIGQYQRIFAGTPYNYGTVPGEPYNGILAYSSTAVDPSRSLLILFGGGHGDAGNNHVWTMDLRSPQDKFTERTPSYIFSWDQEAEAYSAADNADHPGGFINGTPIVRHTFYGNVWVNSKDAMYVAGSSTWQGGYNGFLSPNDGEGDALWNCWPVEAADIWSISPSTYTWSYKGTGLYPNGTHAQALPMVPGAMVYSSTRDRLYTLVTKNKPTFYDPTRYGSPYWGESAVGTMVQLTPYRLWECVPATDTWTMHAAGVPSLTHMLICVDTALDRIVLVGKSGATTRQVWIYPLGSQTWQQVATFSGTAPPVPPVEEGDRTTFSTLTGRVLYMSSVSKALFALTINSAGTSGVWEQITPTNYFVGMIQCHPGCYDSAHGIHVQPVKNTSVTSIDVYAIKA